ncbi:MAG TPA: HIT domain-containing protein [Thermomicrobiales bacterium]|jgi:histidine triad (HIT) family protein|nr:HIT domain-containing protein [Thermomicrobiales bacterium]
MDHQSPNEDDCPLCRFAAGEDSALNTRGDIVWQDDEMAFISPRWWPNNPGNAIVIPRCHFADIYALPDDLLANVARVGKRIAIAMKAAYGCDGTSLRQHNEPAGDQDVFHFHLHVFPRWIDDRLYQNTNA